MKVDKDDFSFIKVYVWSMEVVVSFSFTTDVCGVMDGRIPAFAFYVALALKELFLGNGPLMSVNQL